MYARTSNYRRKDGGRARWYLCHGYEYSTGLCDAKINADVVDAAVIAALDTLLVDFAAWREQIEDRHAAERARIASEVDAAQRDARDVERALRALEADYERVLLAGKVDEAAAALALLTRRRDDLDGAERRLRATHDALASVPTEVPADAMLDFANALQAAINGKVDKTGTMARVNQALRELFSEFRIGTYVEADFVAVIERSIEQRHPIDPDDVAGLPAGLKRTRIRIQPFLREDTATRLLGGATTIVMTSAPDEPPPPLRWLHAGRDTPPSDPEGNEDNSHE
jgi:hypothetical protein